MPAASSSLLARACHRLARHLDLRRRGDHWLWVGGPVPPGSEAITIWSVVSVRRRSADDAILLRHEAEHVRQWRDLGVAAFLRCYLGSYLAWRWRGYGHLAAYRLIPLEIEADDAARRWAAGQEGRGGGGGPGVA